LGKLDDSARLIIRIAYNKLGSKTKVSEYYNIPVKVVDQYLLGCFEGALTSRHVIANEMKRMREEKGNV
jgi:hypothetical protein